MRKTPNILRVGAIVCIAWFAAAALTPITSVAIRNSTMDSTAIGNSSPSTANFQYTHVTSAPPATLPSQGYWTGWNFTPGRGDTDFFNHPGTGPGGFNWYQTNSSGGSPALQMSLSQGNISANAFTGSTIEVGGHYASGISGLVNGAWLGWNQTGNGEMDFINQHAAAAGGFNWYDTTSPTNPGSPIAHMDNLGNLTVPNVNASTFVGSLTGNALSANTLNSSVLNCGATTPATGIQTNGNANCGAYPSSAASSGYATLPGGIIIEWGQTGSYNTGPVSTALAHNFPHACLQATVGSLFTGSSRISSLVSCSSTSITTENDGSGVSTFTVIGW